MKLSDLVGTRTITVPLGDHEITVTYRLIERTIEKGRTLDQENVAESIVRLVESWDLLGDDGQPVPLDVDVLERTVPIPVLAPITTAIFGDVGLGEASSSSDAG